LTTRTNIPDSWSAKVDDGDDDDNDHNSNDNHRHNYYCCLCTVTVAPGNVMIKFADGT